MHDLLELMLYLSALTILVRSLASIGNMGPRSAHGIRAGAYLCAVGSAGILISSIGGKAIEEVGITSLCLGVAIVSIYGRRDRHDRMTVKDADRWRAGI